MSETATSVASPAPIRVFAWEDDPWSEGAAPLAIPIPGDPLSRFLLNFIGTNPAPGEYERDSAEFRYWTARAALVHARDFWEPLLPPDAAWQTGQELPVTLDAGVDLNS